MFQNRHSILSLEDYKKMIPNAKAKIYRFIDDNYVKIVFKSSDDSIVYFEFGGYIGDIDY